VQGDRAIAEIGPVLETARLVLRPPQASDFEAWAIFSGDEIAMRHLGGVQHRFAAWRGFAMITGAWALLGFSMFSVIEKSTGQWIGRLGPWMPEGWLGTEIGWGLAREAWGQGYATEGAAATMDWAFDVLGWTEVVHPIAPDNAPSQAVAKRLGSTILRRDKIPLTDMEVDVWGQTREQWRSRARA
jgi:RimJ/RimL family protein N-acetyltransferase